MEPTNLDTLFGAVNLDALEAGIVGVGGTVIGLAITFVAIKKIKQMIVGS